MMTPKNDSVPATAPDVLEITENLLSMRLTSRQAIFLTSAIRARVDTTLDPAPKSVAPAAVAPAPAPAVVPAPVVAAPAAPSPAPAAAAPAASSSASGALQLVTLQPGDTYHLPGANEMGPFYLVTRGKNPGVYSGWDRAGSEVTGVPTAVVRGVPSLAGGG